jgi:ABC-2 type transport system ATP-binding protein
MDFTDLNPLAEKLTDTLSKGMKQRLSLARTLIHDPDVLLLDEPAAGLDPRARVEVRELIRLLGERGKAILVSSHILTELSEICNGVVIIEKGAILATGLTADVERKLQSSHRVAVELASPGEEGARGTGPLERFLLEQPGVEDVRVVGLGADFDYTGTVAERAEMLSRIVAEGFLVGQYRIEESDLEDLFLQITRGEVS